MPTAWAAWATDPRAEKTSLRETSRFVKRKKAVPQTSACSTISAAGLRRFWNTGESGPDDIKPVSQWTQRALGANVTGVTSDATTVALISGDVLRRYPEAHIYLTRAVWDGDIVVPDSMEVREPLLQGRLNRSTRFYGFNVSTTEMRGRRTGSRRRTARTPRS